MPFSNNPIVGILSSSISFGKPYAGAKSNFTLKIIMATNLLSGDAIILYLNNFIAPHMSFIIPDIGGNVWAATWNPYAYELRLISGRMYPAVALEFTIEESIGFSLPIEGISSACQCLSISLSRQTSTLTAQSIQDIQNVGAVVYSSILAVAQSKYSANHDEFTTHRDVAIALNLTLSNSLNIGDEIFLFAPNYTFYYDSIPVIEGLSAAYLTAFVNSAANSISFQVSGPVGNEIQLQILPSGAVGIPMFFCNLFSYHCPQFITITSHACPILDFLILPITAYNFPFASISLKNIHYLHSPTPPPTVISSGNPSNPAQYNFPTQAPTSISTVNQSAFPAHVNSTNEIPSGQPTSSPSVPPPYLLEINLELTIQTLLPSDSLIKISAPQFLSQASTNDTVVIVGNWSSYWNGSSQVLLIRNLETLVPGAYAVSIISSTLLISNEIIYANDSRILYSIDSSAFTVGDNQFDVVVPNGLATSSIAFFDFTGCGNNIGIKINITAAVILNPGDHLEIRLPNFNCTTIGHLFMDVSPSNSSLYATWENSTASIQITIVDTVISFSIILPTSNQIVLPLECSNINTGLPTVSLRTHDAYIYAATTFQYFTPISNLEYSFLSFTSSAEAGSTSTLFVGFQYALEIFPYDTFVFFLPNFWSTSPVYSLNDTEFRADWSSCDFVLQLTALKYVAQFEINITVFGLRLPLDGISVDLAKAFTLASNATSGQIISTPLSNVQLIGYFPFSSLSFDAPSIGRPITMNITFAASFALKESEAVFLFLPMVDFIGANLVAIGDFIISWDINYQYLVLTALQRIEPYTTVTLLLNNSALLPPEGFPPYDSTLTPKIGSNASEGPTPLSPLSSLESVGVTAVASYDITDLDSPIGITFTFQVSSFLHVGDVIDVITPLVRGSTGVPLCSGTLALLSFQNYFNVSYSSASNSFNFVVNQDVPSLVLGVVIGPANEYYLNRSPVTTVHYMVANISSIGTVSRSIDHFPTDLLGLNNTASVSMSSCNVEDFCQMTFLLNVASPISITDFFTIGHSSILFPYLLSGDSIRISGNASTYFSANVRKADAFKSLRLGASLESSSRIVSKTDISYHPVNITIPLEYLPLSVITKVPSVYGLYISFSPSSLLCGDVALIELLFTEPVQVFHPSYIQLHLNTDETANYYSGNLTSKLTFIYHVVNPTTVTSLAVLEANAVTMGRLGAITKIDDYGVQANTTIPEPFSIFSANPGTTADINVSCGTNLSNVVNVTAYGLPSDVTLATGDILFIAVNFNRAITVVGSPSFEILGDNGTVFTAIYRNVSLLQWIEVEGPGEYTLFVGSENSPCIPWNNSYALHNALASFKNLIDSLPVTIFTYPYARGIRYRLEFQGLPPEILGTSRIICNRSASVAVSIDQSMDSTAIFEYQIRQGDMASHLSYPNQSSLIADSKNMIYLLFSAYSNPANLKLPLPGSAMSLSGTTNITVNTTSPNVERVYSDFNSSVGYAVAGDDVFIYVRFSSPVTVIGFPYITLNLNSSLGFATHLPAARYFTNSGYLVKFLYSVHLGDFAFPLDTFSNSSFILNGSKVLLQSLHPSTKATTNLPVPRSSDGLYNSSIIVNASSMANLLIVSCDQPPGVYGAGMVLVLKLIFSDEVFVTSTSVQHKPSIFLAAPKDAQIQFVNGSGTDSISFLYLINYGQNAESIEFSSVGFSIQLQYGEFGDLLGNRWGSITRPPQLNLLSGIIIDTSPPYVILVNSTNADGVYYPGQILDITVTFSKKVQVFGAPMMELFVPYEYMSNKLAKYVSGNGSYDIHFEYMVPPADFEFPFHPQVPFDYAGDASLYQNLNEARIIEAHGTTPADVVLSAKDHDYLRYNRSIFLNFNAPSVLEVRSRNVNGVYTGTLIYL